MSNTERKIRIVVDASAAEAGAARVNSALSSIGASAGRAGNSLRAANDNVAGFSRATDNMANRLRNANGQFVSASGAASNLANSLGKASRGAIGLARSVGGAALAITGLTMLVGGVRELATAFTSAADTSALMEAKLRIATTSAQGYASAQRAVLDIANKTRSDIAATTDLYTKMSQTTTKAGAATQSFAMLLKVGGAETNQATAAILQLGQALGSGKLSGDEFVSLNENAGEFMKTLAASLGVARGDLKKLAAEGKITSDVIIKALTDPAMIEKIEAQFGKIPVTFGDIKTAFGNMMVGIAGALKSGLGIDDSLAVMIAKIQNFAQSSLPFFERLGQQIRGVFQAIGPVVQTAFSLVAPIISTVVTNMDSLVRVAMGVGAGFIAMKASMGLAGVISQVTALGGSMGFAGGMSALFTTGMTAARNAVNGFTASLMANPFTALITAATVAITLLYQFRDSIKIGTGEFGTLGDMGREVGSMLVGAFQAIGGAAKSFMDFIAKIPTPFGVIGNVVKAIFGDVNLSFFGALQVAATVVDKITGNWIGSFFAIKNVWAALPQTMGALVSATANGVITGIENMINRAISGINGLIAMANKIPAVNIGALGNISMGRVNGPAMPNLGNAITSGWAAGQNGIGARAAVDAFGQRVEARGRNRQAAGANVGAGNAANDNAAAATTASEAADKAKKNAAEAAKRISEFWQGLEASRDAAGLLGIELDRHNAALELRKAIGNGDLKNARELTDIEKARINALLTETATRKAVSDLQQTGLDRARETALLQQRGSLIASMTTDQLNDEMAVRERMATLQAKFLQDGVNLNDAAVMAAMAREEAAIRENNALERGNKLLSDRVAAGRALMERYDRAADPRAEALRQRTERDLAIRAVAKPADVTEAEWQRRLTRALDGSAREYERTMTDIASKWRDDMMSGVNQIADAFGGKIGDIINQMGRAWEAMSKASSGDYSSSGVLGGIAKLFGGTKEDPTKFGEGVAAGTSRFTTKAITESFNKPMSSMSSSFSSFTSAFSGANGGFVKGLGSAIGGAMQGSAIGSAVAGVGQMVWKQFSGTGSQIGGMVGSIFGPIGSVLGSIGGGILGGLIGGRKVSSGKAGITLDEMTGTLQINSSGKHGGEAGAVELANKVVGGITNIAQRLGATFGGNPVVAVGKNGGDFRVSPTGGGVTGKQGINFKTEAEAVAFAIKDLISDGILTGISSFSERLLKGAKNLDSAVGLAESYEKLLKELGQLKDPVGSSINELTTNLERMAKQMKLAGATSDELAKVEEYKKLKLDQILKDQLGSVYDFRRELFGEGSGISALNRLTASQEEFSRMQATIQNGGTVNQDDFTRSGQEILSLAREVYGTSSSQFQAIRQMLIEATDGQIANVTKQFDDATVAAFSAQTDQITANQTIQNDYLRQIAAALGASQNSGGGGDVRTSNGVYMRQQV